jgi:hypothetical protein
MAKICPRLKWPSADIYFDLVISLLWRWSNVEDDATILQAASNFLKRVKAAATARGTFHRYQYLNYASVQQDVYGSYGEENKERLIKIRNKYDPDKIISKLRSPGAIRLG